MGPQPLGQTFRPEACVSSKLCEFNMLIMVIREEADMVAVQKKVYNALATDLEAQRARLPCQKNYENLSALVALEGFLDKISVI